MFPYSRRFNYYTPNIRKIFEVAKPIVNFMEIYSEQKP